MRWTPVILTIVGLAGCLGLRYTPSPDDIAVTLSARLGPYSAEDSIVVALRVLNTSGRPLHIPAHAFYDSIMKNEVRSEDGVLSGSRVKFWVRPRPGTCSLYLEGAIVDRTAEFVRLNPGEAWEDEIDIASQLEGCWETLEAGDYELKAWYSNEEHFENQPRTTWMGHVESNAITLMLR